MGELCEKILTEITARIGHWNRDEPVAISQTTIWNEFFENTNNMQILIKMSLKFVFKRQIDNIPS